MDKRLSIALIGLCELEQQLQQGDMDQAALTLHHIDEDLRMLRQRLASELAPPADWTI